MDRRRFELHVSYAIYLVAEMPKETTEKMYHFAKTRGVLHSFKHKYLIYA